MKFCVMTPLSLLLAGLIPSLNLTSVTCRAQQPNVASSNPKSDDPSVRCTIDLSLPGKMKDIVSNALMRGLDVPEDQVAQFLLDAEKRFDTGPLLLTAAAQHFGLKESVLAEQVERFKHCNCKHGPMVNGKQVLVAKSVSLDKESVPVVVSQFAQDVTMHVVLHELGHALVREFDLPILGNEECLADAFATYYLTKHLPERAFDVIQARTRSLMIEANEVPREQWTVRGEHNNDARRAYQIVAIAVAADHQKYNPIAQEIGLSENDIRKCRDYGSEIHRSWRRILRPLWMPAGQSSTEARVKCEPNCQISAQLKKAGFADELEAIIRKFDWHSQVTIAFVEGDGGAGWSRSKRTITVNSQYIRRFIEQGKISP